MIRPEGHCTVYLPHNVPKKVIPIMSRHIYNSFPIRKGIPDVKKGLI